MKALVVGKPESYKVEDVPVPQPGPGEVLIQVKACCVCGTDQHIVKGDFTDTVYPVIPGHEFSGTVHGLGEGVDDLEIGDMVSIEPFIACGYCYFCQIGEYNACRNGEVIGMSANKGSLKLDGGFAEYVVVPRKNVYVFKNSSFEEASFLPNLNTVVSGMKRARFQPGDSILIIGAGTMGLLYVQLAKANGSPLVVITDRAQNRLDLARELGADECVLADENQEETLASLTPYGFDVVVEGVGNSKLLEQSMKFVRDRGRIIVFGMAPKDQLAELSPLAINKRNLEIIGSFSAIFCGKATRDLIDSGIIKITPLISHRFPLEEFNDALAQAARPEECIRVVVNP